MVACAEASIHGDNDRAIKPQDDCIAMRFEKTLYDDLIFLADNQNQYVYQYNPKQFKQDYWSLKIFEHFYNCLCLS